MDSLSLGSASVLPTWGQGWQLECRPVLRRCCRTAEPFHFLTLGLPGGSLLLD